VEGAADKPEVLEALRTDAEQIPSHRVNLLGEQFEAVGVRGAALEHLLPPAHLGHSFDFRRLVLNDSPEVSNVVRSTWWVSS
jgi:hypothetical protein